MFVVEGYTDVIGLAQAGIENAVATCGTALGEGHFRLLSRFAQQASWRSTPMRPGRAPRSARSAIRAVPRPGRRDDHAGRIGSGRVRREARTGRGPGGGQERSPVGGVHGQAHRGAADLSNVEGQSAAVASALPILQELTDPVRRSEYGHLLADLTGVSEDSVRTALDRRLGGHPEQVAKTLKRLSARDRVEREMLRLLVRDGATFEAFAPQLTDDHVRTPGGRAVLAGLREHAGDVSALAGSDDPKIASAVSALAVEPMKASPRPSTRRARATAGVRVEGEERRVAHPVAEAESADGSGLRRALPRAGGGRR